MTALEDDVLQPELLGDVTTVAGLLAVLGVRDAPLERQARAVRRAAALPGVGPILERLRPELEAAALI